MVGLRRQGRVRRCDDTWLASDFFSIPTVPLVPVRSYVETATAAGRERIAVPLDGLSIVAAYLRWFTPVLAALVLAVVTIDHMTGALRALQLFGLGLAAAGVWAWTSLGRNDPGETARARCYDRAIAAGIDPAWLGERRALLARRLEERLAGVTIDGARADGDRDALEAWLALTRLRWSLAEDRAARRALDDEHERVWRLIEEAGAGGEAERPADPFKT